ncbi:Tyrosine recombinase XerA [uncultured archaeon]|nr:Tyrosine recombinase XerA [uncultured archaeon]
MNEQKFIEHLKLHIKKRGNGSELTHKIYLGVAREFETFLQGREPTPELVSSYVVHIIDTHKNNGQQPKLGGLRHYLRFVGWEDTKVKELVPIPKPVNTKTEDDILTPEEIQKMYNATKDEPVKNAMLKCFYPSALRKSEFMALNIDDLREADGIVIIKNGKGMDGQPEEISPQKEFWVAVREYLKVRPQPKPGHENALFIQPRNLTRITNDSIRRWISEAQINAGVHLDKRVTAHWFRASVITHMHNNGASDSHIMELSRHKSHKALETYIRPNRKQKRENVDRFVPTITETKIETQKPQQEQPQVMYAKPQEPVTTQPQVQGQQGFFELLKQGLITPQQYQELVMNSNHQTSQKAHTKPFDPNYG